MRIEPNTLCLIIGAPGLCPGFIGMTCTFLAYAENFELPMPDSRCDCAVRIDGFIGDGGSDRWGFPSRALLPLGGWDAEQELALDVRNELAVRS